MSLWYEGLELGVPVIDDQHRQFFERMEDLVDACAQGLTSGTLNDMKDFLHEYARSHFRIEEELMLRYGYPGYPQHKEMHGEFMEKVQSLEFVTLRAGRESETAQMIQQMLVKWFEGHILTIDRNAMDFLIPHLPKSGMLACGEDARP